MWWSRLHPTAFAFPFYRGKKRVHCTLNHFKWIRVVSHCVQYRLWNVSQILFWARKINVPKILPKDSHFLIHKFRTLKSIIRKLPSGDDSRKTGSRGNPKMTNFGEGVLAGGILQENSEAGSAGRTSVVYQRHRDGGFWGRVNKFTYSGETSKARHRTSQADLSFVSVLVWAVIFKRCTLSDVNEKYIYYADFYTDFRNHNHIFG